MKKGKVLGVIIGLLAVVGAVIFAWLFYTPKQVRQDFERLESESYSGIFVSSLGTEMFQEEVFNVYRGVPTVIARKVMESVEDYADYFNKVWESGNVITNVYMGVDPYLIWEEAGKKKEKYEELLRFYFLRYMEAHTDVTFEIMLPYENLDFWLSLEESRRQERFEVYSLFVEMLSGYSNVIQYYPGCAQWLTANPGNYENGKIGADAARLVTLLCFCDHEYQIVSGNAEIMFDMLRSQISEEETAPSVYADLSEYAFVFFGDSIIANVKGSHSIPGVVSGLTGAQCYNLAVGGIAAAVVPGAQFSLPEMVDCFVSGAVESADVESDFAKGLQAYQASDAAEKKHVFVLNFGLNDYFSGCPVSVEDEQNPASYAGALRKGIGTLQQAYPEAVIIVQTPTYSYLFSEGKEVRCDDGSGRVLEDYAAAALAVAEEMGVYCLDNYFDFPMDGSNYQTYLADGTHPNDYGRFVWGKRLAEFVGDMVLNR